MNDTIQTVFLADGMTVLTENVDGKLYLIEAKSFREILDDWNGECRFVPANDARVFFASYNEEPVNPYCYTDFESLLRYMAGMLGMTLWAAR